MNLFSAASTGIVGNELRSIRTMLLTEGFGSTLEYLCTISAFSLA